jgi:hypothetical protein
MLRRQLIHTSNAPVGSNSFDPRRLVSHLVRIVRMNSHLRAHWVAFDKGDSRAVVLGSNKRHKKLPACVTSVKKLCYMTHTVGDMACFLAC